MDDFGDNKQVIEILNDYISLKNPQFAILINGKWGCGKSWLIKKYIDYITVNLSEINEYSIECKNICYISLFGFKNIDEIDYAIFRYFHPILTSQKTSIFGNIGDFILDKIPFSFSLPINKNDIKEVGNIIKSLLPVNKDDLILILDDFERNKIDPQTLFGYINNHLEKYHAKVIIISNSEEIENDKFKDIKEKVIGQTVTVVPDISNSFTDNIDKIADQNIKDIFLRNKDKLLTIFNNSNSHNLRNIIKIIFEFSRIYKHIEESYKSNIELIDKILIDNFIMSIEIHSNFNKLYEMVDLESQSWKRKNNNDKTNKYNHITFLNSKYNTNYIIFNPKFWYEFIFNGIISQEILNYGCKKFIEELQQNFNDNIQNVYTIHARLPG